LYDVEKHHGIAFSSFGEVIQYLDSLSVKQKFADKVLDCPVCRPK
jgi:hypothetical protein